MASYLIALGSNRRHGRHGRPEGVLRAAVEALGGQGCRVVALSRLHPTAPVGPGTRRFANAVAVVESDLAPMDLLGVLKRLEADFGRRRGRRWGDRVLDLDIVGAGGLVLRAPALRIPHPGIAARRFVLDPLVEVAPGWRHPVMNATARQLRGRAMRPKARA